jgi:ribosomal protein L32
MSYKLVALYTMCPFCGGDAVESPPFLRCSRCGRLIVSHVVSIHEGAPLWHDRMVEVAECLDGEVLIKDAVKGKGVILRGKP